MSDSQINNRLLKHLHYFWLGIANRAFVLITFWLFYCFAPVYFHLSMNIALFWYLTPIILLGLFAIYMRGKYISEKLHG